MLALQTHPEIAYARSARRPVAAPASNELVARLATDRKTRHDAYALRHASYLADGLIDRRPDGLFQDDHDETPNCPTFVVYRGRRPAATVRVCMMDLEGEGTVPATKIFTDEIADLAKSAPVGRPVSRIMEISRLARHPDFSDDPGLVFALFRLAGYMILRHDADLVLSCVRRNHVPFYTRLRFKEVAGPRMYPGVTFETFLLACFRPSYDSVRQLVPILNVHPSPDSPFEDLLRGQSVPVFAKTAKAAA